MSKDELFDTFCNMFPDISDTVKDIHKVGSKTLALTMPNGKVLFFLYNDIYNWNLGTKQWRKVPSDYKKKGDSKNETESIICKM